MNLEGFPLANHRRRRGTFSKLLSGDIEVFDFQILTSKFAIIRMKEHETFQVFMLKRWTL